MTLNIVCFRFYAADEADLDELNREIVADLQESGVAVPSTTRLDGKLAIIAALINRIPSLPKFAGSLRTRYATSMLRSRKGRRAARNSASSSSSI